MCFAYFLILGSTKLLNWCAAADIIFLLTSTYLKRAPFRVVHSDQIIGETQFIFEFGKQVNAQTGTTLALCIVLASLVAVNAGSVLAIE